MHDVRIPAAWAALAFRAAGWHGFVRLTTISPATLPVEHGVYVVLRDASKPPVFVDPRSMPKRRRAWYAHAQLESRWVIGAEVVYLGKAGSAGGLRERVIDFARNASGHSGGRSIWQLADSGDLLVAWVETPGEDPQDLEDQLLFGFQRDHDGRLPFANVRPPRRC